MAKGSNTFGGTLKLGGETEYKQALKNITSQLGVVSSEMSKVNATFGKSDKSVEGLTAKDEVLNKQLATQQQKVEALKNVLELSKEQYGENDNKTLKWQQTLNKAEADLIKTTNELEENKQALEEAGKSSGDSADKIKEFGKAEDDAGQKALTLGDLIKGNLISEGIISGIKGLAGAMKSVGSGLVDIGKQAVSGFGEFEQLEGGVEKLFGKDVKDTVIKNANDAFKTAGMSANEYMETVTGFSKSMIVSLNGDTKKAAQLSDQALRDMSDNANTFGTDMQSIQNAYSGFAKGQFNMLDNLKLGYGGTKTEMERLLADAEKLTGKKYDVSNFADITEAIHAIQVQSKIAGTTEKEALGTIEGSLKATKSAWSNLITGLATDGADFSQLIQNLFSALVGDGNGEGGVVNNVLKTVDKVVDGIFEAFPMLLDGIFEQLPAFLETGSQIISKLVQGLTDNLPMIMDAIMQILNMLVSTIIQNLPQIVQMGIQLIVSLVKGIADSLPTLIPQMIDALILMVTTLLDNIDLIIDAGIQLLIGLAEGLINALPQLIEKIPVIIEKLVNGIVNNAPKLLVASFKLIVMLAKGLIQAIPQLLASIPKIVSSIVKGFGSGLKDMLSVGKNLVKGIWNGISDATGWILDKIKGFGKSVLKGIKSIFGIHSPSTLFRDEVGKNLALGLGLGFENEMKNVSKEMTDAIPSNFDITPDVKTGFKSNKVHVFGDSSEKQGDVVFNATINNNSKYTSPADNIRLLRKQWALQKLKYNGGA